MVRSVFNLGPEAPDVPLLQTLDTNFAAGLNEDLFYVDGYPWLWRTRFDETVDVNNPVVAANHRFAKIPVDGGGFAAGVLRPNAAKGQRTINRESQYYVRRHEDAALGENLAFVNGSNNLVMRAKRTPAGFEDTALGNVNNFVIQASDFTNNTITVRGESYYRTAPSDDGQYEIGPYIGLNRFLRDELTSDPSLDQSHKRQKYAYGWMTIKKAGMADVDVRYSNISDSHTPDPPANTNATTLHTITILDTLTAEQFPGNGDQILLMRHMPYVSKMFTTNGSWAQKYWMVEYKLKLPDHARQFFAMFGWSAYLQLTATATRNAVAFAEQDKSAEADLIECPGSGPKRRFHNIWAPTGGMFNYAEANGLTPVIDNPGEPEWDNAYHQQHQILNDAINHPTEFVEYINWTTLRNYWWPPGNSAGKPGNSMEWYVEVPDGRFLRLGGALCPPWWDNGIIDEKQLFINFAVYGDFCRSMDYTFSPGSQSTNDSDSQDVEIEYVKGYQFVGQVAGGSGHPDRFGKYPNGLGPTPGDTTNSGTGVVQSGGNPGGGVVVPPVAGGGTFATTVDVEAAIPERYVEGVPFKLHGRLNRNAKGFTVTPKWTSNLPAGMNATIVDDTAWDTEVVFDPVPDTLTATTLFADAITLEAIEAGAAGTAPIIDGDTIITTDTLVPTIDPAPPGTVTPDSPEIPDSQGGTTDTGSTDGVATITVLVTGPVVSGVTNGVPEGRQVRVSLDAGDARTGTVAADGTWSVSSIPVSYAGESLRAYTSIGPPLDTPAEGGHFTFTT